MALAMRELASPESDIVIHQDIIANNRSLTDHNSHAMVDKEASTDCGGRVDLNPCDSANPCHMDTCSKFEVMAPQKISPAITPNRMNTWIDQKNL